MHIEIKYMSRGTGDESARTLELNVGASGSLPKGGNSSFILLLRADPPIAVPK